MVYSIFANYFNYRILINIFLNISAKGTSNTENSRMINAMLSTVYVGAQLFPGMDINGRNNTESTILKLSAFNVSNLSDMPNFRIRYPWAVLQQNSSRNAKIFVSNSFLVLTSNCLTDATLPKSTSRIYALNATRQELQATLILSRPVISWNTWNAIATMMHPYTSRRILAFGPAFRGPYRTSLHTLASFACSAHLWP